MTVTMSPTWYDLLDVEPTASTDEIRAAWKAAVADLDPTDRRFRRLSEAAAVLLDEDKRAAYDAGLAEQEARTDAAEPEVDAEPETEATTEAPTETAGVDAAPAPETEAETETDETEPAAKARTLPVVPLWVLAAVAVLTVAAVVAAVVTMTRGGAESGAGGVITAENRNHTTSTLDDSYGQAISHDHVTQIEENAQAALSAAKQAVVPVLSYDYRHLTKDQQQARAYMTAAYRKHYDQIFALIKENAPHTKTVVKTNPPVDAGVVHVSSDRVQVLLFVDRPTTNAKTSKPIPYQNYVTLTMAYEGGRWLVDDMTTTPGSK